jgi:alanyl-tRNA synthetase
MTEMLTSAQIRQQFLDFFRSKDHLIVPSASLAPVGDPTLLFTNAGMNQFKDYFLGLAEPEARRVADAQKCMRVSGKHNDLEDVGRSPYHHTLFEMLGNWSFGDYYKKEAITWAWELLTEVWQLPREKLWATVFQDDKGKIERDDEAAGFWKSETSINPEQVLFFGRKDNFWEMGDTGPCGPCSEIHLDMGPDRCDKQDTPGHVCSVNGDCRRYIELWNLVFIQYNRAADGELTPLPARHVDTGMGFERMVQVLQGKRSNYETDLFVPIIAATQKLLAESGVDRDVTRDFEDERRAVSYRVIADHARTISFLIGDGVMPANEGRGYVLRLILRRAARHGRMLGFTKPFLHEVAQTVIDIMGGQYDELVRRREFILTNIEQEETRFSTTLINGLALLDEVIADVKSRGETVIPGDAAFRLYDTHGFPLDLTQDVARDQGLTVDVESYKAALAKQKERGRESAHFGGQAADSLQVYLDLLRDLKMSETLPPAGVAQDPYDNFEFETTLAALVRDGQRVTSARVGDKVEVVVPHTPFYVESGGQVTDTGFITSYRGDTDDIIWEIEVRETRRPVPGLLVHVGEVTDGAPRVGDPCWAEVDYDRRLDIMRNHTATHVLHRELRNLLGEHVHQAGSVVAPDRLRFDFTHSSMLTQDELDTIEEGVNHVILEDFSVDVYLSAYKEAVKDGATALFTEKYGDEVRVIEIGWEDETYSKELCGGTHVSHTGEIAFFHIVSEESIGSGVRRIEAVTGREAQRLAQERLRLLDQTAAILRVPADQIDRAVRNLYLELQAKEKENAKLKAQLAMQQTDKLLDTAFEVKGVKVIAAEVPATEMQTLREMSDKLREQLGSGIVVLATAIDGKPQILAAVTDDLLARGAHAGELVKNVARVVGGGGGGRPSLAQAGGRDLSKLREALAQVRDLVAEQLKK